NGLRARGSVDAQDHLLVVAVGDLHREEGAARAFARYEALDSLADSLTGGEAQQRMRAVLLGRNERVAPKRGDLRRAGSELRAVEAAGDRQFLRHRALACTLNPGSSQA